MRLVILLGDPTDSYLKLKTYMDEELGKEYEEWLDEVEKTLPLPIPEEEENE